jgi:hypothetical protein
MKTNVILVFNETQETREMSLSVINAADGSIVRRIDIGDSYDYYDLWSSDEDELENPVFPILVSARFLVRNGLKYIHKHRYMTSFQYIQHACKKHRDWNILNIINI